MSWADWCVCPMVGNSGVPKKSSKDMLVSFPNTHSNPTRLDGSPGKRPFRLRRARSMWRCIADAGPKTRARLATLAWKSVAGRIRSTASIGWAILDACAICSKAPFASRGLWAFLIKGIEVFCQEEGKRWWLVRASWKRWFRKKFVRKESANLSACTYFVKRWVEPQPTVNPLNNN